MSAASSHHSTGKTVITRQLSRMLPCFVATPTLPKSVLLVMRIGWDLLNSVGNQQNSGLRLSAFSTRIQQIWIRRLECTRPSTSSLLWTRAVRVRQDSVLRQPTKPKLRALRNSLVGKQDLRMVLSKGQANQHSHLSHQVLKERNSVAKTRYGKYEPLLTHAVWMVGTMISSRNLFDFAPFRPSAISTFQLSC